MATVIRNPDGTYTVTLTPAEQSIVAKRAAKDSVTLAVVMTQLVTRKLREWIVAYRDKTAAARQDAYESALPSAQATADAAISFTPPEI